MTFHCWVFFNTLLDRRKAQIVNTHATQLNKQNIFIFFPIPWSPSSHVHFNNPPHQKQQSDVSPHPLTSRHVSPDLITFPHSFVWRKHRHLRRQSQSSNPPKPPIPHQQTKPHIPHPISTVHSRSNAPQSNPHSQHITCSHSINPQHRHLTRSHSPPWPPLHSPPPPSPPSASAAPPSDPTASLQFHSLHSNQTSTLPFPHSQFLKNHTPSFSIVNPQISPSEPPQRLSLRRRHRHRRHLSHGKARR